MMFGIRQVLMAQYKPATKIELSVRGEYYADKKGVIIAAGTPNGSKHTVFRLMLIIFRQKM